MAPESPGSVAALGEHGLIERIRRRVPPAPDFVPVGIGDDAAVIEPARNTLEVLTTDCLVEGVHFDRRYAGPADIGWKALAVNLSDLAAMGATPRVALLSLALPDALPLDDFDGLLDGLLTLSDEATLPLVGGNISRSPGPLVVDLTVSGWVKRRRVLTRAGARPGDELWVSGWLGGSAAGLASLQRRLSEPGAPPAGACEARHLRPTPRLRLGTLLGRTRTARACIDLSDGLSDGVHQLAAASGVGAVVEADRIPIDRDAQAWCDATGRPAVDTAITSGEEYELLFAVPPKHRRRLAEVKRLARGLPLTRIGHIAKGSTVELRRPGRSEPLPRGFVHF